MINIDMKLYCIKLKNTNTHYTKKENCSEK